MLVQLVIAAVFLATGYALCAAKQVYTERRRERQLEEYNQECDRIRSAWRDEQPLIVASPLINQSRETEWRPDMGRIRWREAASYYDKLAELRDPVDEDTEELEEVPEPERPTDGVFTGELKKIVDRWIEESTSAWV